MWRNSLLTLKFTSMIREIDLGLLQKGGQPGIMKISFCSNAFARKVSSHVLVLLLGGLLGGLCIHTWFAPKLDPRVIFTGEIPLPVSQLHQAEVCATAFINKENNAGIAALVCSSSEYFRVYCSSNHNNLVMFYDFAQGKSPTFVSREGEIELMHKPYMPIDQTLVECEIPDALRYHNSYYKSSYKARQVVGGRSIEVDTIAYFFPSILDNSTGNVLVMWRPSRD
jgi:hypothetical protein